MDFKNFLCFSDVGGLGNRICQLLGNIKLCEEKYNSNIYLCFKNKKYDIFSELFDINFKAEIIDYDYLINILKKKYPLIEYDNNNPLVRYENKTKISQFPVLDFYFNYKDKSIYFPEIDGDFVSSCCAWPILKNEKKYHKKKLKFQYHNTPDYFKNQIKKYINYLKPKKEILNIVKSELKKFNKINIGFHIRGGDRMGNEYQYRKTIEKISEKINNYNKNNENISFFIASDEIECILELKNKFKNVIFYEENNNRIHRYNKNNTDESLYNNQKEEKNALIDLLLLSKCDKIISNYKNSTFTQLAWYFSNCSIDVESFGRSIARGIGRNKVIFFE